MKPRRRKNATPRQNGEYELALTRWHIAQTVERDPRSLALPGLRKLEGLQAEALSVGIRVVPSRES